MAVKNEIITVNGFWLRITCLFFIFFSVLVSEKVNGSIACSEAPLSNTQQWVVVDSTKKLECTDDFDHDGKLDKLTSLFDGGGSVANYLETTLKLSKYGKINLSTLFDFTKMIHVFPIPEVMLNPELSEARATLEKLHFRNMKKQADASLSRLIGKSTPLNWQHGMPTMPVNYAVRMFANKNRIFSELDNNNKPVWLYYAGFNHRRLNKELSDKFTLMHSNELHSVYGTAHGVVLYDRKQHKHAWAYVFEGGFKLRWPSVQKAHIKGDTVVIHMHSRGYQVPGKVIVNFIQGTVDERFRNDR